MAVISPPAVTPLPIPPSTSSPTDFDTKADAFLGALPTYQTEENALANNVFLNATDAASSASNAASSSTSASTQATNAALSAVNASNSAALAASASGASIWVSGSTYSVGDVRYSPVTNRVYRRLTNGSGTTDPSLDNTNWGVIDNGYIVVTVTTTSVNAIAGMHYVLTNVSASTVQLPLAPSSGDVVVVTCINSLATNTVTRNTKTIMGLSEDLTIDKLNATITLRYLSNSWRII